MKNLQIQRFLYNRYNSCINLLMTNQKLQDNAYHRNISTTDSDDVLIERNGNTGLITLNRPKHLNALNLSIINKLYSQLKSWNSDSTMKLVIIKGMGDKAFSAGTDVKAIVKEGKHSNLGDRYFRQEYTLNNLIATLSVPYVALINGICMGGGVGLSIHGTFRVVTEKAVFAMPGAAIGFFSDIGASHFLPRLPGKLGLFLALTGFRLVGRDIFKAGIATHFVPTNSLNELEEELRRLERFDIDYIDRVLNKYQEQWEMDYKKEFSLKPFIGRINYAFGEASSVEQIIEYLKKDTSEWSKQQVETLNRMSPTSLKVTFEQLRRGSTLTLPECLKMEFRISQRLLESEDFFAGVKAVLIDRHNSPVWSPSHLSDISEDRVQSFFAPLSGNIRELQL